MQKQQQKEQRKSVVQDVSGHNCELTTSTCDLHVLNLRNMPNRAPDMTILSENEIERGRKFRDPQAFRHFVWARWLLRTRIGERFSIEPGEVELHITDLGRPFFKSNGFAQIDFNLSHSGDYVVLAIADGCRVGVDVECAADTADADFLKPLVLSHPGQHAQKRALVEGFSVKEAVLKALGTGLAGGMDSFDLPDLPIPGGAYHAVVETGQGAFWCQSVGLGPKQRAFVAFDQPGVIVRRIDVTPTTGTVSAQVS